MAEKILVIGGGIVGVSVATQLLRRGKSVVLADSNRPGSPDQASYGNAGILAREGIIPNASPATLLQFPKLLSGNGPMYVNWKELPFDLGWIWNYVMSGRRSNRESFASAMNALIYDTLDQHLSLAEGTPASKCIKLGDFSLLYPTRRMRKAASTSNALRSDFGIEFTYRERTDLQARDPNLGPRYKYAVDFHDHGWIVNPSAYIDALFENYLAKGGLYLNRNVVELGNGQVTFDDGMVGEYDQIPLSERREWLLQHSTFYVFGGEESYGYLASDRLRDKDANAAVLMFAEMAASLGAEGKSILQYLDEVYLRYGYYIEDVINNSNGCTTTALQYTYYNGGREGYQKEGNAE